MNKRLIIKKIDGGISQVDLTHVLTEEQLKDVIFLALNETKKDSDGKMVYELYPHLTNEYRIVDLNQIPSDREFRDAWTDEFDTDTVDVHNGKAKDLQLERLRADRNFLFEEANLDLIKTLLFEINESSSPTLQIIKAKWESLKNATDPLKAFEVTKLNCAQTLDKIKELGKLN